MLPRRPISKSTGWAFRPSIDVALHVVLPFLGLGDGIVDVARGKYETLLMIGDAWDQVEPLLVVRVRILLALVLWTRK